VEAKFEEFKIKTSFKISEAKYYNNAFKPYLEKDPEIIKVQRVARFIPIVSDGFLMQRREKDPDKGKFEFPGGKIDPTDTNSKCATERELIEEIGEGFTSAQYFDYLETTYRVVDKVLYVSDFWMADDVDPSVFKDNCYEKGLYIHSWDFLELTNPKDFAFDHYEVAKNFALNIGN